MHSVRGSIEIVDMVYLIVSVGCNLGAKIDCECLGSFNCDIFKILKNQSAPIV